MKVYDQDDPCAMAPELKSPVSLVTVSEWMLLLSTHHVTVPPRLRVI